MLIKAKKNLGQHFLVHLPTAKRIVDAFLSCPQFYTIEIGAGTGVLTKILLQHFDKNQFIAIDIDKESIEYLKHNYPEHHKQFLLEDFLHSSVINDILAHKRVNIIGNFPYNISTQIMFKILEYKQNVQYVIGMFQREVAKRICSAPGNKDYGILSVLLQAYFEVEYLFTVNEFCFQPPPKVKSAVIKLKNKNIHSIGVDEKLFFEVVKTAFNQRRKTLRNSLSKYTEKIDIPYSTKRPEQLSFNEFIEITAVIENAK